MANKKYTGLSKIRVTVPAKSVYNQQYIDTRPNYFRIQNHGEYSIYAGTDSIPTLNNYDIKIEAGKMKAYGEPFNRQVIYLFNPSDSAVDVTILSFAAEFDPLILAFSEMDVEIGGTISGEVSVTTMPSLPAGTNKIGMVELDTYDAEQLHNLSRTLTDAGMIVESFDGSVTPVSFNAAEGRYISKVNICANDKATNQTLIWYDFASGTAHSLIIKAGEILNDLNINARSVEFGGGRLVITHKEI